MSPYRSHVVPELDVPATLIMPGGPAAAPSHPVPPTSSRKAPVDAAGDEEIEDFSDDTGSQRGPSSSRYLSQGASWRQASSSSDGRRGGEKRKKVEAEMEKPAPKRARSELRLDEFGDTYEYFHPSGSISGRDEMPYPATAPPALTRRTTTPLSHRTRPSRTTTFSPASSVGLRTPADGRPVGREASMEAGPSRMRDGGSIRSYSKVGSPKTSSPFNRHPPTSATNRRGPAAPSTPFKFRIKPKQVAASSSPASPQPRREPSRSPAPSPPRPFPALPSSSPPEPAPAAPAAALPEAGKAEEVARDPDWVDPEKENPEGENIAWRFATAYEAQVLKHDENGTEVHEWLDFSSRSEWSASTRLVPRWKRSKKGKKPVFMVDGRVLQFFEFYDTSAYTQESMGDDGW